MEEMIWKTKLLGMSHWLGLFEVQSKIQNKIIDKINKLLKLSQSSNIEEAMSLMIKHIHFLKSTI